MQSLDLRGGVSVVLKPNRKVPSSSLSKAVDGGPAPVERVDELLPLYVELLRMLAAAGAEWVQLDEPVLVTDILDNAAELAEGVYRRLGESMQRPALFVATYFGALDGALPAVARTPVEAIGVDLVAGGTHAIAAVPELAAKLLVAGVVDGRNVWATDLSNTTTGSVYDGTASIPYRLFNPEGIDPGQLNWCATRTRELPIPASTPV